MCFDGRVRGKGEVSIQMIKTLSVMVGEEQLGCRLYFLIVTEVGVPLSTQGKVSRVWDWDKWRFITSDESPSVGKLANDGDTSFGCVEIIFCWLVLEGL